MCVCVYMCSVHVCMCFGIYVYTGVWGYTWMCVPILDGLKLRLVILLD